MPATGGQLQGWGGGGASDGEVPRRMERALSAGVDETATLYTDSYSMPSRPQGGAGPDWTPIQVSLTSRKTRYGCGTAWFDSPTRGALRAYEFEPVAMYAGGGLLTKYNQQRI